MRQLALAATIVTTFLVTACGGNTVGGTSVGDTTATLSASVSCSGARPTRCQYYFQYGTGGRYQSTTPAALFTSTSSNRKVSAAVSNLLPGATYKYQLCGREARVANYTCVGPDETPGTSFSFTTSFAQDRTISAQQFADSIGINAHDTYFNTPYGDWTSAINAAKSIGAKQIRLGIADTASRDWNARHWGDLREAVASGFKLDVVMNADCSYLGKARFDDCFKVLHDHVGLSGVEAVEYPNESSDPNLPSYGRRIYNLARAYGIQTVYGPSGDQNHWPDLSAQLDFGNMHDYTGATSPTPGSVQAQISWIGRVAGSKSDVATEFGFWTGDFAPLPDQQPGIDESGAAVYTLRQYLEHLAQGVDKNYAYELVDESISSSDPDQNFGMFHTDWTPKPAATALTNLTQRIGSGAPAQTSPLHFAFDPTDPTEDLRYLTIEKPDGRYALVLWRTASVWDRNSRQELTVTPNTIHVCGSFHPWVAYDPILGEAIGYGNGTATLQVGADPIVLEITP